MAHPRTDPSDASPEEMFSWMRDVMMPAVREGRTQTCYLHHKFCSDSSDGRCSMVAMSLITTVPENARDAWKWLYEIQKAEEKRSGPKSK